VLTSEYAVFEAGSVDEGLSIMAAYPVDLVLLDVMLPGTSGRVGCRLLKGMATGFLPVLFLTALGEPADVAAGFEAGADDFLTKPVNLHELSLRVAAFVRLRRQEQALARQVRELWELSALKDDLVGVLVHDLRNPLSAIVSVFHELARTVPDPAVQEDVYFGLEATKRVLELADDLLTVRLLEEGKLSPELELSRPSDVVREAVEAMRPIAKERSVRLEVHSREDVTLPLDRKLLRRAVENLVANALKYTRGSVEVRVTPKDGCSEVLVADRGPGIPDGVKPALFEKYGSAEQRLGQARRGVGLGLYLVRLVASMHHGDVSVQDRPGGGTVFRLTLCPPA
jgi:signal transduction histidine kinase